MSTMYRRRVGLLAAVCVFLAAPGLVYGGGGRLPDDVRESIRKAFPSATVTGYGRETENGVRFYEVNLRDGGLRIEVEVDKYGGIGEIERRIGLDEAPAELLEAVAKVADKGSSIRVERHERWGVAREGRFVTLTTPRLFYEVKYYQRGQRREKIWRPDARDELTDEVEGAIRKIFPRAVITEVEKENENGVKLYQSAVIQDGHDAEMTVSPDGAVIEVEARMSFNKLPKEVSSAVSRVVGRRGKVKSVKSQDVYALTESGMVVKLDKALRLYEVEYVPARGKGRMETLFSADGTMIESDLRIPVKEVPRAVMATVAKEAGGAKVTAAEKEIVYARIKPEGVVGLNQPLVIYELELSRNGMEAEIEVMANGKLVSLSQWEKVDNDEDDDDDEEEDDD